MSNLATCPFCGQAMACAKDFPGLRLSPAVMHVLYKMWQHKNTTLAYDMIHTSKLAAYQYISVLRRELIAAGFKDWRVITEKDFGAGLFDLRPKT